MDSFQLPDAPHAPTGVPGGLDCNPDVAGYVLLAHRVCGTLAQGNSLLLAIGEPSPDAMSLRWAIEAMLEPAQIQVVELPCGLAHTCAEISEDLARFVARDVTRRRGPSGNGALVAARTLVICSDADRLEDDQLRVIHLFVGDRRGEVAAVLLASPDFLVRLQRPGLEPIRDLASLCLHLDEPGGSEQVDAASGEVAASALNSPMERCMVFEGNEDEPIDTANASRALSEAPGPNHSPVLETHVNALSLATPRERIRRRPGLTLFFCLVYILCEFAILCIGWQFFSDLGDAGPLAVTAAAAQVRPDAGGDLRGAEGSLAHTASAMVSAGVANSEAQKSVSSLSPDQAAAERPQIAPPPEPTIAVTEQTSPPSLQSMAHEDQSVEVNASQLATDAVGAQAQTSETNHSNVRVATSPPVAAAMNPARNPAESMLSPEDVTALLARGESFFASGDIASARLFFERAANEGNPQAAFRMGQTFDSTYLSKAGVRGVPADASRSAFWYQRAQDLAGVKVAPASIVTGPQKDDSRD